MAYLSFDASEVAPAEAFEPLPPAWYTVEISASELKPTKDGMGEYLQLELTVLDGQFSGRKVWDRLNVKNQNIKAVEISRRTLSAICMAVKRNSIQDSSELHSKPLQAKISIRPASGGYEASNDIKGYRGIVSGQTGHDVPPPPTDESMPAWA